MTGGYQFLAIKTDRRRSNEIINLHDIWHLADVTAGTFVDLRRMAAGSMA